MLINNLRFIAIISFCYLYVCSLDLQAFKFLQFEYGFLEKLRYVPFSNCFTSSPNKHMSWAVCYSSQTQVTGSSWTLLNQTWLLLVSKAIQISSLSLIHAANTWESLWFASTYTKLHLILEFIFLSINHLSQGLLNEDHWYFNNSRD